jgi:polysaccharide biosynthesis transport protein
MADISSLPYVFARHKLQALLAFSVVLGSCLVAGALTPAEYQSEAKLLFQDGGPQVSGIEGVVDKNAYSISSNPIENKLELLRTEPVIKAAIAAAAPRDPKTGAILNSGQIRSGIVTKQTLGTDIVVVSFKSGNPNTSRIVVNAISNAFVNSQITNNRSRATAVRDFIQGKLPEVERNLKSAERDLQNFQRSSGSVEIATEAQSAVNNLSALEVQQRGLSATLNSQDSQIADLRRQLNGKTSSQARTEVAISEDPDIQALRTQLAALDGDIAKQSGRLGPESPQMQQLLRQRGFLQTDLDKRIQAMGGKKNQRSVKVDPVTQSLTTQLADLEVKRSGTAQELATVVSSISQYGSKVRDLPQRQVRYAQLSRKVQVNSTAYNMLANKLEEAKIAEAQGVANVKVIEPASVPTRPVWPNFFILGATGTAVGLVAAIGVVALKEALSRKVLSQQEAQQLLELPVLASLPWVSTRSADALGTWNREAYRMLCTNLFFLTKGSESKVPVTVISSAIPNEGKSTVATRLAFSMSQAQQRTLLIDADLIRPSLGTIFSMRDSLGFSEWLHQCSTGLQSSDKVHPITRYIRPTATPNLHVLPAGQMFLEDSAGFLSSQVLDMLLDQLSGSYDQIIVDTPPLAGHAHGYLFGAKAKGVLLVVRPDYSEQEPLARVKQSLERNNIQLLGVILTGVNARKELAYSYDYYDRGKEKDLTLALPPAKD